jgi:hypothetical protein
MIVIRIARSTTTRRVLAVLVIAIGVASAALAPWVALTAEDRFAGTEGIDRIAAEIARQTGDAEDVVRDALLETLRGDLRVDVGGAVWLVVAGGLVLAAGGGLTLAWIGERERSAARDAEAAGIAGPEGADTA